MLHVYGARDGGARDLLARALERAFGLSALPALARGARGKPFFPDHPHIHFNLSHSGPLALCAVGSAPVGVDIEVVRPRREGLARYALDPGEYARFLSLGGRWEDFYTCWTRRESWCKYTGAGVAATRRLPLPADAPLHSYGGDGWRAAVCADEPAPGEILWLPLCAEIIRKP